MTEVRAADLRFTPCRSRRISHPGDGPHSLSQDIVALERAPKAGLPACNWPRFPLQGHEDAASFIRSFTGSHHFVLDYLLEEVLEQQPERIQHFLLRTSLLDRMSGPLCDAVVLDPLVPGKKPWTISNAPTCSSSPWTTSGGGTAITSSSLICCGSASIRASPPLQEMREAQVDELHLRASQWYEDQGLELEAFQHAAATHDVERAARLVEGEGMPLLFRGAVTPVLHWLESLPKTVLDARPCVVGDVCLGVIDDWLFAGVEEKLQAAEAAMQGTEPDDTTKDLVGQIAAIRAMLAVAQNQVETIIAQSHRALEYLHPNNLASRTSTLWTLGFASFLQGDRAAARQAYTEAISLSQAAGNFIIYIGATIGLGHHPGSRQPAVSGSRDLPARPAPGRRSAAAACLRSASWPGPPLLRMERPGCRRAARATERPPGAAARKHRQMYCR